MNIDWDNLAEEMSDTPRARLQAALDQADEMVAVLIVFEAKGASHLETQFSYMSGLAAGAGASSLLGLAEFARRELVEGMRAD